MDVFRELTTKEKALKINLEPAFYGSFAEIGAGQEIADHFFKAGGASGTIAKTMSAYDMQFSDAIYGKSQRYVSQDRLNTMLDHEYSLLIERLGDRVPNTSFFALANTVETLNFRKTNRGHGWMGVRFQVRPNTPPNEVVIHFMLKDNEALWQQEAIGIIGVNLLYGILFHLDQIDQFLAVLMQGLSRDRIELDMLRISGPDFLHIDNRLLALKLVKRGMTNATLFGADGKVVQASEALYKKNLLMLRGRFRPPTLVNLDMLRLAREHFLQEEDVAPERLEIITELTLNNLTTTGTIDEQDFLDRVDILCSLGQTVMISNYQEYYRLVAYLSTFTRGYKMGIVLGVMNLELIFEESHYTDLQGGILEAFGILFGRNVKLLVYPAQRAGKDGALYTCNNFQLPDTLYPLFHYLHLNDKLHDITEVDPQLLHITSDEVLRKIKSGEEGWEAMVPEAVAEAVKSLGLFDYQAREQAR